MISIGSQNFLFASAASSLTSKLRSLSFRAILRQDSTLLRDFCVRRAQLFLSFSVEYFDREENSVRNSGTYILFHLNSPSTLVGCYRV
jgi:hypothetical protein